jgi:hypothetical protein
MVSGLSLELEVVGVLPLDTVLAGDRPQGVAWSMRPSRSAIVNIISGCGHLYGTNYHMFFFM